MVTVTPLVVPVLVPVVLVLVGPVVIGGAAGAVVVAVLLLGAEGKRKLSADPTSRRIAIGIANQFEDGLM